ncbi:MAG TPA: hypothetical protein P5294_03875 [Smithellaceae bacterium]|nr:hypothetical protein [Smithellaceae bacterium]HRS88241.1 hypothetical protein [Smithellaceae bacterium]HRV25651.1 hypothetical protein [Smithellaceae bacterium]
MDCEDKKKIKNCLPAGDIKDNSITRRDFLKNTGKASVALAGVGILSSLHISCGGGGGGSGSSGSTELADPPLDNGVDGVTAYLVKNGSYTENITKLFDLMGGIVTFIGADDVVIIKGNAQWPNQGYTHTGCIKAVIDVILSIPGFSGEILICDNTQLYGSTGAFGFDATPSNRNHNWPDYNWDGLATYYQSLPEPKPVATKRWLTSNNPAINSPAQGEGWVREFFDFHGDRAYLSYPIFASPLTPGRLIDPKNGVWENGGYTGRKVKTIFMPTLNNHGSNYNEDYAGITSAIKCFFGATEIHGGVGGRFNDSANIHTASYSRGSALYAGELAGRYIKNMYSPVLYITCAMWSGHESRTGGAVETKAVLACTNPATLDFIAGRDVIGPHNSNLNPIYNNNTRQQIVGCMSEGIGTIIEGKYTVVSYDFSA